MHAQAVEQRPHCLTHFGRPQEKAATLAAEEDVVGDAQVADQRELLVDRADPTSRARRADRRPGRATPSSSTSPSSGATAPLEDLDDRGLAGAVLADERVNLAAGRASKSRPCSTRTGPYDFQSRVGREAGHRGSAAVAARVAAVTTLTSTGTEDGT